MNRKRRGKLAARSKIWLEQDGRPVFGDGKAEILEHIDRRGSLKAAAQALGMGYRDLWGRLREMERRLGMRLVLRRTGGCGGGSAELTDQARELLDRFRRFRKGINAIVDARFREVFGRARR